jgi:hypothetical protein
VVALGGLVVGAAAAIWPHVELAFTAVARWLSANSEAIWNAIAGAAGAIAKWVNGYAWPAIEKAAIAIGEWVGANKDKIWEGISTAATAVAGWLVNDVWPDISGAAVAIGKWVVGVAPTVWGAIKGTAEAIGNWVSENKEGLWNSITGFLHNFGEFITETLWPFLRDIASPTLVAQMANSLGVIGDIFNVFTGDLSKGEFVQSLLTRGANAAQLGVAELQASLASVAAGDSELGGALLDSQLANLEGRALVAKNNAGLNLGSHFYVEPKTGSMYMVQKEFYKELERSGVVKSGGVLAPWGSVENTKALVDSGMASKIGEIEHWARPEAPRNYVPPVTAKDAIITSDGQVIHTDPEDNIYAFKGDVSIAPANSMREFSGAPVSYNNSQSTVNNNNNSNSSNVTNNYVSNSNFNLADLFPASEFDPVGV